MEGPGAITAAMYTIAGGKSAGPVQNDSKVPSNKQQARIDKQAELW